MSDIAINTVEAAIPILMQFAGYQERHTYECIRLTGKYCGHCNETGMCWLRDRQTINSREARKAVTDLNWLSAEIWIKLKDKIVIDASTGNINEQTAIATARMVDMAAQSRKTPL